MASFHYQALNEQQQLVTGVLDAESVAQALAELEAKGLVVQSIGYASSAGASTSARSAASVPQWAPATNHPADVPFGESAEQAALRTHLASVLERGAVLVPALRAYAEEMPAGRQRTQLTAVLQVLQRGDAAEATTALIALPEYWIPLLSAAATRQDPGRVLQEFLSESQRATELRRQWWQTFAYPLVLAAVAGIVLTMLSFLVTPVFRNIFQEFALRLPAPTVLVLDLAAWITSGRILIVAALLVAGWFLLVGVSRLLPMPVRVWFSDRFGTPLGRTTALARFAQFSADLLEAGLTPPSALRIAGYSTHSMRLRRAAWQVAKDIESGPATATTARRGPLGQVIVHALRSEMPLSARVRLLREISRSRAEQAALRTSWTRGTVEPVAICVIAGIVGVTVLALFLPLISLIHGLAT